MSGSRNINLSYLQLDPFSTFPTYPLNSGRTPSFSFPGILFSLLTSCSSTTFSLSPSSAFYSPPSSYLSSSSQFPFDTISLFTLLLFIFCSSFVLFFPPHSSTRNVHCNTSFIICGLYFGVLFH